LDRHHLIAAIPAADPVAHEVARDREEPAPQRALAAETVERRERANERVLHDFLHLLPLAQAGDEARDRGRVAPDEHGGGALIPAPAALQQDSVLGLVGRRYRFRHPVVW